MSEPKKLGRPKKYKEIRKRMTLYLSAKLKADIEATAPKNMNEWIVSKLTETMKGELPE